MNCFIYKSRKKEELYLYLPRKDDFSEVPDPLYKSMGDPIFLMDIELTPERKLAREDSKTVLKSLKDKGYFIQLPPTRVPGPHQRQ